MTVLYIALSIIVLLALLGLAVAIRAVVIGRKDYAEHHAKMKVIKSASRVVDILRELSEIPDSVLSQYDPVLRAKMINILEHTVADFKNAEEPVEVYFDKVVSDLEAMVEGQEVL